MKNDLRATIAILLLASPAVNARAGSLSPSEKIAFAKWWADSRADVASAYSNRWEVSFVEFDFDKDAVPEIVASEFGTRGRGSEGICGFRKNGNDWNWMKGDVQTAPFLGMQWAFERAGQQPEFVSICCHVSDIRWLENLNRKPVEGAPDEPFFSLDEPFPEADKAGLPLGDRTFYAMMEAVSTEMSSAGVVTNIPVPGGIRDLIADPDFSALCRLQVETYGGTNGIPTKLADPCWTSVSDYRRCREARTLSWTDRNHLADAMRKNGFPAEESFVIASNLDDDSLLEAIVTTNNPFASPDPVPWTVWRLDGRGWRPAEVPLRKTGLPPSVETGWSWVVPPEIPTALVARGTEFYRVWFDQKNFYVDSFRVFGPNPWDVTSLFDRAASSDDRKPGLWANGYRRLYESWTESFEERFPEKKPARDFFQLFEPGSGMIQLERMIPEKLLP